jgi:hypothetical protein
MQCERGYVLQLSNKSLLGLVSGRIAAGREVVGVAHPRSPHASKLAADAADRHLVCCPKCCPGEMRTEIRLKENSVTSCKCWWAREDSNLQPSGYEPPALTVELRAPTEAIADEGGGTKVCSARFVRGRMPAAFGRDGGPPSNLSRSYIHAHLAPCRPSARLESCRDSPVGL